MLKNHGLNSALQAGDMLTWLCFFVNLFLWASIPKQANQHDAEKA